MVKYPMHCALTFKYLLNCLQSVLIVYVCCADADSSGDAGTGQCERSLSDILAAARPAGARGLPGASHSGRGGLSAEPAVDQHPQRVPARPPLLKETHKAITSIPPPIPVSPSLLTHTIGFICSGHASDCSNHCTACIMGMQLAPATHHMQLAGLAEGHAAHSIIYQGSNPSGKNGIALWLLRCRDVLFGSLVAVDAHPVAPFRQKTYQLMPHDSAAAMAQMPPVLDIDLMI